MADRIVRLRDMDPPLPILAKDNGSEASFSLSTGAVTQGTLTNKSGTIATGGTAQVLAAAKSDRRYLLVQNASIRTLWVSPDATAVAGSPSIALKACAVANDGSGGAIVWEGSFVPTGAISIIGVTTGDAFTAKEG